MTKLIGEMTRDEFDEAITSLNEREKDALVVEIERLRTALQEARADAQHYMANGAEAIRELATLRAGVDKAREALAPFAAVCPPDDMLDEEGDEPTPLSETPSSCALFVNELAAAKHALSELDALSGKGET